MLKNAHKTPKQQEALRKALSMECEHRKKKLMLEAFEFELNDILKEQTNPSVDRCKEFTETGSCQYGNTCRHAHLEWNKFDAQATSESSKVVPPRIQEARANLHDHLSALQPNTETEPPRNRFGNLNSDKNVSASAQEPARSESSATSHDTSDFDNATEGPELQRQELANKQEAERQLLIICQGKAVASDAAQAATVTPPQQDPWLASTQPPAVVIPGPAPATGPAPTLTPAHQAT